MTQLSPRIEHFGPGDQSWLGSDHGVDEARTVTLDASAMAPKIVDGYIKSGEPLAKAASGKYVPYNSSGSNGTNVLAGFLVADVPVVTFPGDTGGGDIVGAMLKHGFVIPAKLPSPLPTDLTTVTSTGLFVYVDH